MLAGSRNQAAATSIRVPLSAARWRDQVLNVGQMNGAQGRNRTTDTAIFSRMLYQLSYLGIRRAGSPGPEGVSGSGAASV